MFYVRSSPCPAPNLQSPPLHATCTAVARHLPPPSSRPAPYALLSTRQQAYAFNQPLSFDTSSVTNMGHMFYTAGAFNQPLSFDTSSVTDMRYMFQVRSSPLLAPNLQSSPPLHAARRRLPPPDRKPSFRPSRQTRQGATAFNQPLSFDTSSVTDMFQMFWVRSSPCPAPNLQSSPPPRTLL